MLRRSGGRFGVRRFFIHREDDPIIAGLHRDHPDIMVAQRGAGYWLWKPFIIAHALDRIADGTTLLYTDAATAYIADPGPLVALAEAHPIITFLNAGYLQLHYTKRDCFVLLNSDTPADWTRPQLDAAYLLLRAGQEARAFVKDWADAMTDPRILTDQANTCGLPNLDGFIDHRHDQSVLTIIAPRHGAAALRCPRRPRESNDPAPYEQIFHHHRQSFPWTERQER